MRKSYGTDWSVQPSSPRFEMYDGVSKTIGSAPVNDASKQKILITSVVFEELILRLRISRTIQLTQNPERMPLGVLASVAVCLRGFRNEGWLLRALAKTIQSALGLAAETCFSVLVQKPLFLSDRMHLSS